VLVQGIKNRHWASSAQASSQAVFPSAPPLRAPKVNAAGSSEAGEKVFAIACAGCHGSQGEGGEMAGAINDPAFLSLMSDELLRRYVITGRPDLDMPNFAEHAGRDKDFSPLTSEQIGNLVNLLAQWRSRATTP
jgi:mono/diheme cytochrome c family protein